VTRQPSVAKIESKAITPVWRSNQALIDAIAARERREFQESLLAQIERLQRPR